MQSTAYIFKKLSICAIIYAPDPKTAFVPFHILFPRMTHLTGGPPRPPFFKLLLQNEFFPLF